MISYIKKHPWYIAGLFIGLFLFKSCQSCSNSRKLNFERNQNTHIIDSLTNKLDAYKDTVKTLQITNKALIEKNGLIQDNLKSIQQVNQVIRQITEQDKK